MPAAKGSRDFKDKISACQRYKNYENWVNTDGINTRLKQEAKYFALEYFKEEDLIIMEYKHYMSWWSKNLNYTKWTDN